ncbi:MAG: phosphohydrolase [Kiloniellales bacterium]|nr:phosphohydrolase [Kiloniellales bacterium]
MASDDIGKMHFKRMDEGTRADFQVMARVHEQNLANLPDLLMGMLTSLKGDEAYPVDRLAHSLQSATRALRDGKDEEYIVCCLLHDVCEALGPFNHGAVIAAILKPFICEANAWMLEKHGVFQTYFYGDQIGIGKNQREKYRDSPYYDRTVEFTSRYDEVSFDPDYPSEPLSAFEPMLRGVLKKKWSPPAG